MLKHTRGSQGHRARADGARVPALEYRCPRKPSQREVELWRMPGCRKMATFARPRGFSSRTLGLFVKQPRPGEVKTRLAADTSADWAAQGATAFLLDSLER